MSAEEDTPEPSKKKRTKKAASKDASSSEPTAEPASPAKKVSKAEPSAEASEADVPKKTRAKKVEPPDPAVAKVVPVIAASKPSFVEDAGVTTSDAELARAGKSIHVVSKDAVREWTLGSTRLDEFHQSIGKKAADDEFIELEYGLPTHLRYIIEQLSAESLGPVPKEALDSIPFYSLAKGLFLPLSGLHPDRVAALFGIVADPPPDVAGREALLSRFLERPIGLSQVEKIACILGDPFRGKGSSFKRDSLVRLYQSIHMVTRRETLDRLTVVGDPAVLFAEARPSLKIDPPLTSREVLETLRFLPLAPRTQKFDLLRSLFLRTGKLEAYFLAKLILRKAGFGFDYQGALIARALAEQFSQPSPIPGRRIQKVSEEEVGHAMALTDAFKVADILAREGPEGLRKIQLQPLVPVRPALASGTTDEIDKFPVWVERKYDGIRLMLHKSTDARGSVLSGAYTRTRGDWLELVPGLDASIRALPARTAIVDGELYGTTFDLEGSRPATVYEIYALLQGEGQKGVNLRYAAFDLIYLDGRDLTRLTLGERRRVLELLMTPMLGLPLPVPMVLAEGQLAKSKEDVNRLYQHFRNQGHEGIVSKDLDGEYKLAMRDPAWLKRKPEITLDLVLLGAVMAVTSKERAGLFGSYVIAAKTADGAFEDVGSVAGVDRVRDLEIQTMIAREGLLTGRRFERDSASGVRPGVELRPFIVVTVKFEGIAKEALTGKLSLRDPKIAYLRSDKGPHEADTTKAIEDVYLRQRVG
ncbi:MAG: hypothetical protein HY791_26245 [Deltaproteobacteria bacterium]|nr:hypothetical protein [Deltaproteobacteria bacterium]